MDNRSALERPGVDKMRGPVKTVGPAPAGYPNEWSPIV
jgi:hypothetical protein